MANMEKPDVMRVENGRLIIDVALGKGSPSATGKTTVYFSTHGNVKINDDYVIGVNLYRK